MSAYFLSPLQYKEVSRDDNDQPDCVARSHNALLQKFSAPPSTSELCSLLYTTRLVITAQATCWQKTGQ